ncbi:MAG: hypothetical protein RIQ46_1806 [Pseudomonadota bacterium]|jgi:uncharacterized metal-binding protein YceD (DUF177 family)
MIASEFSRCFDVRQSDRLSPVLEADAAERVALARRFAITAVNRLVARLELTREGRAMLAAGTLEADIVQPCAVSGEDLAVAIREPLSFRFVPAASRQPGDAEVELEAEELDEIEYEGTQFDLGEAVAQSLALAIDPYLTGPNADAARAKAGLLGEADAGPFAALKALKKD